MRRSGAIGFHHDKRQTFDAAPRPGPSDLPKPEFWGIKSLAMQTVLHSDAPDFRPAPGLVSTTGFPVVGSSGMALAGAPSIPSSICEWDLPHGLVCGRVRGVEDWPKNLGESIPVCKRVRGVARRCTEFSGHLLCAGACRACRRESGSIVCWNGFACAARWGAAFAPHVIHSHRCRLASVLNSTKYTDGGLR